jgi:hypothetical protein
MPTLRVSKKAFQELVRFAASESSELRREAAKVSAILKRLNDHIKLPGWKISSINNEEILLKTHFNGKAELWRAYPIHIHCIGHLERTLSDEDIYARDACNRERIVIVEKEYIRDNG